MSETGLHTLSIDPSQGRNTRQSFSLRGDHLVQRLCHGLGPHWDHQWISKNTQAVPRRACKWRIRCNTTVRHRKKGRRKLEWDPAGQPGRHTSCRVTWLGKFRRRLMSGFVAVYGMLIPHLRGHREERKKWLLRRFDKCSAWFRIENKLLQKGDRQGVLSYEGLWK